MEKKRTGSTTQCTYKQHHMPTQTEQKEINTIKVHIKNEVGYRAVTFILQDNYSRLFYFKHVKKHWSLGEKKESAEI